MFMGWCLVPFALLRYDRYWKAFGAVNYVGIILFGVYPFAYGPLLRVLLKKKKPQEEKEE